MNLLEKNTYRYLRMGGVLLVFALLASYFTGIFSENILFVMLYVLFGIAIVSLLGFLIYQLATNARVVRQFVMALAGLLLVGGFALLLTLIDGASLVATKKASIVALGMGSTVFYCIYIIVAMAVVGILITEIRNLLKR